LTPFSFSPMTDTFPVISNIGVLLFGFLLGMRHAFESDHVAAVSTLVTRSNNTRETIWMGVSWGIGHTFTLFLIGSMLLLIHVEFPEHVALILEFMVGMMLVVLGADVLRRIIRNRVHVHIHTHVDGIQHIHFHAHTSEGKHGAPAAHRHSHKHIVLLRPFIVGTVHGMAGSAALLLLTLQTLQSPLEGIVYIFMFGLGTVLGMTAISFIILAPLQYAAKRLTWFNNALQSLLGSGTIAFGVYIIFQIGFVEGLLTNG